MRIVMFYHSILSDWNHGNAHFLRGIVTELGQLGHEVTVYEPENGWSYSNMLRDSGEEVLRRFQQAYPGLTGVKYRLEELDLDRILYGADLVIVHEWSEHELVRRLGEHRKGCGGYRLLFHDTHHRSVTDEAAMAAYDLSGFDGVLAYGGRIREIYLSRGWAQRVWLWHEAADVRVFRPLQSPDKVGDVVWIGNWGDDERSQEIREFFVEPVRRLHLKGVVYGVRYPSRALQLLAEAGIGYGGWLPNFEVPRVFSRFRLTVHIPRRPYLETLPGIPTIRPFEALACGIPLLSAPWVDSDGLFTGGSDLVYARDGKEMERQMQSLLHDPERAQSLAQHGRETILARHTCRHRVEELLAICRELGID
ncbi:glycosyltransferase [Geomonas oryzisoli]|uniref:Glycosyltransferase n=1 Tax=Geomonas oryzisoli TaxID=2847992 RepID=A0ABX8J474_9BACT|nr:glycosyltransferase [Geomonas oryzisoli]QWV91901.1 glycosyltransferase [Geomonas oryzisoli]